VILSSLEKPKTAFFSLFEENLSKSLFLVKKSTKIYPTNGTYCTFDGKRLNFMQSAGQTLRIICCVLKQVV